MVTTTKRWASVKQTAETYPGFSEHSLRWIIFNKNQNGFNRVMRQVGRKIIIDLDLFEEWVEAQDAREAG